MAAAAHRRRGGMHTCNTQEECELAADRCELVMRNGQVTLTLSLRDHALDGSMMRSSEDGCGRSRLPDCGRSRLPDQLEEYDEEPSRLTGKEGYISRAQEEPGEQRPVELCGKRRVVIAA